MSANADINQPNTEPSVGLQKVTRITRALLRRNRIAELVLLGKTEAEIAEIVGCAREHVARLKVDARTQERIAFLLEQQGVTGDEVRMTLASHMRADITDLYDEDGHLRLDTIRERNLGHLIKKLKQTRRYEKKDGEMSAVDEIEVELNGQQSAAVQLSKIMGIEREPIPADDETRIQSAIARCREELLNNPEMIELLGTEKIEKIVREGWAKAEAERSNG